MNHPSGIWLDKSTIDFTNFELLAIHSLAYSYLSSGEIADSSTLKLYLEIIAKINDHLISLGLLTQLELNIIRNEINDSEE